LKSGSARLVAKYWFERFARLPVEIDVAFEFRYREALRRVGSRWSSLSRARARIPWRHCYAKGHKQHTVAAARGSDAVTPTLAGPEIGVACTKAFTCHLAVLLWRSRPAADVTC